MAKINFNFLGNNTAIFVFAALAGAALAVSGVFAANPAKNIPRPAINMVTSFQYSPMNAGLDTNNVNPWFGTKNPYVYESPKSPVVDYGDDISGPDMTYGRYVIQ